MKKKLNIQKEMKLQEAISLLQANRNRWFVPPYWVMRVAEERLRGIKYEWIQDNEGCWLITLTKKK